ncbi:MAG TPA: alpha-L-fucosidase, partial [Duganella sp.]|nr:alpha-L-fucosidase [Duganella sp.]
MKSTFSAKAGVIPAVLIAAAALLAPAGAIAQGMSASERPIARLQGEDPAARIQWWRGARFGMFIHWGLYSIPGRGEWVQWNEQIPVGEYAKLADQFNPAGLDFDTWTEVAKAAGMKYMVMTARHHDGFALFDDGANPYTSVNTGARRDLVADYVKAVRKAGLGVGLYYSPLDWRFPGYFFPDLQRQSAEAMRDQYHRQVEKLMSNYGKIDVLWFDGGETEWLNFGADWTDVGAPGPRWAVRPAGRRYQGSFSWQHEQMYASIRRLQPQVLMNGRADMPEDFRSREGDAALGEFDSEHPWELCTTIAGAWGYQPGAQPKPLKHYIQLLAKVAGRDG